MCGNHPNYLIRAKRCGAQIADGFAVLRDTPRDVPRSVPEYGMLWVLAHVAARSADPLTIHQPSHPAAARTAPTKDRPAMVIAPKNAQLIATVPKISYGSFQM